MHGQLFKAAALLEARATWKLDGDAPIEMTRSGLLLTDTVLVWLHQHTGTYSFSHCASLEA